MKSSSTHIIGRQPVLEALREGSQLERIYLQKNTSGDAIDEIRVLAQKLQIPINAVPVEKLNSFTRSNHQGVIGLNSIIQYIDLQDAIDHTLSVAQIPLFVMLDGITVVVLKFWLFPIRGLGLLMRRHSSLQLVPCKRS
jgi:23S rRNA (guanosine2251-2'-O)-methyltransferase